MTQKQEQLSKNQQIVLNIIEKAKGPLKAYSILYNVQKRGIKVDRPTPIAVSYTHLTLPTICSV